MGRAKPLPEIERCQYWQSLAQQPRQPRRAFGPEAPSAAERDLALPLGPDPAHQFHVPIRRHLPAASPFSLAFPTIFPNLFSKTLNSP
jgi:hypothetical protein